MSGGSWNYMYSALDCSGQHIYATRLREMAARMRESVAEDCVAHSAMAELVEAAEKYEALFERLGPIFRSVEWEDSGDSYHAAEDIRAWPGEAP